MDGNSVDLIKVAIDDLFDSIKEIGKTAVQERQETARVQAKTKALVKINENQCKMIVKACDNFDKKYLVALKADAASQKFFREKAHELTMYFVVQGIEPPQYVIDLLHKYLNNAIGTYNVNNLPDSMERSLIESFNSKQNSIGMIHNAEKYIE